MNPEFERIKERLDLRDIIVSQTGLQMKGKHLEACPFCSHKDCFSVDSVKGFHCFSCGKEGDVFNFLEEYHDIDRAESLRRAAALAGVQLEPPTSQKKEKPESLQDELLRLTAEHYHGAMLAEDSPGRRWFCGTRGHKPETLQTLRAGAATDGLLEFLKAQGFKEADIQKHGLAKERGKDAPVLKDFFWKGFVVFPVIDHAGRVLSFTSKDPSKQYRGLMLPGSKKKWFLNYKALGKGGPEQFLVEGENDVASLLDIGLRAVVGTAGEPSADQFQLLKNFCSGKTLYLWFDRDPQRKPFDRQLPDGTGGPHHIRAIGRALADSNVKVRIIEHGGEAKDPDEFIQGHLRAGKPAPAVRAAVNELKAEALSPLEWEISQLKGIPEAKGRLEAFKARRLVQELSALTSSADQAVYVDAAAKAIGIPVKSVEELVNQAVDLHEHLADIFEGDIRKADPHGLAMQCFRWFENGANARFFKTGDGKTYLFFHRKRYEIGNNLDFNTLMFRLTHKLAAIEKPGNLVWYYLQTLCNQHGDLVDIMSWLHTDREKDVIYINLNSPHSKIVRIAPGEGPSMLDNGTNENAVMLNSSPQIRQFEYLQSRGEAEGFRALKSLLMDTTPCENPQRYFLMCWLISTFMMNYQSDRGLLQIIASSQVGKSKVAERMSQLIYGESFVGKGTGAAETRVATSNPIVFLDNLENRNLTQQTVDFLLFVANTAHKPKAKSGSDTEVLFQKLNTMSVITSIEAFPGKYPELINRTFPLLLDSRFKLPGYMHDEVMRKILKSRNLILSALFEMLGKDVLPQLGERQFWSQHLQASFAGHNKERNNEHICTMLIILEGLLKYLPYRDGVPIKTQAVDILSKWIAYQEEQAQTTAITSNTLLTLMDGLAREIMVKMRGVGDYSQQNPKGLTFGIHTEFSDTLVKVYEDPEYMETFFLTEPEPDQDEEGFACHAQRFEVIVTAKDLWTLFNRYCANQHIRNPFENPTSLGARISNDKDIMEKGGWEYVSTKPGVAQFKKIQGNWHWRFRKSLRTRP